MVGSSWEPQDWYYAQTNAGTWTISFNLNRPYTGTAFLTVSTSMQQGGAPAVAVNGSTAGIAGSLPNNNDSTIARQADRSVYPRLAVLSFPASMLHPGANTITLTRGAGTRAGNGLDWDTFLLEVDEDAAPAPAQLAGKLVSISSTAMGTVITLQITNTGAGDANDVRLDGFTFPRAGNSATPMIVGRDPNRFPVPVVENIPPGGSAVATIKLDSTNLPNPGFNAFIPFSANGGRAQGMLTVNLASAIAGSAKSGE